MPAAGNVTRYVVVDRSNSARRARSPYDCRLYRPLGRPRYKYFATEKEAHAYGARMVAGPSASDGRGAPFVQIAQDWRDLQRGMDLKATTIYQYQNQLRNWVIPDHGRWGFHDYRITTISGAANPMGVFDSDNMGPEATFEFTFHEEGTPYCCTPIRGFRAR